MDWLKLTKADIERAKQQAQASPPMPAVITIDAADLVIERPAEIVTPFLQITSDDLIALSPQADTSPDLAVLEDLMFNLINQARHAHLPSWMGTPALKWHDGLAAVARGHSADMLKRGYVEHESPEGVTAARRIERHGIRYIACGENIGVVYSDTDFAASGPPAAGIHEIHHAFMNQPRRLTNHRGNVLNPIWTHVGVGLAHQASGALFATQNFMSAPGRIR
jgi:uncharacterized protein YkwD